MQKEINTALETGQYPEWLLNVVTETKESARAVTNHEAWFRFSDGTISKKQHQALLMAFWRLFERFPKFLALNLLKCDFGSDSVMNGIRSWLLQNLKTEQWHPGMYRDWAVAAGVTEEELFDGHQSESAKAITDWCWEVSEASEANGLAEGLAAIIFAIQGVTSDWAKMVWESGDYPMLFDVADRKHAMRWIQTHASYNPLQALEMIHELLGDNPDEPTVNRVKQAIKKSYVLYASALDEVMGHA